MVSTQSIAIGIATAGIPLVIVALMNKKKHPFAFDVIMTGLSTTAAFISISAALNSQRREEELQEFARAKEVREQEVHTLTF